jgi:selenocysteine-specific elongation factor
LDRAEATPRLILGTAGHIDHGKTSLVRALTGVDTDRLPEEKARGITIDLGFAPLDLPGGMRLGVVDVPGHERLVRTMVAGATGIDLLMLVVAADEGVMPQTREHLAICELLGLERGVVALTKSDLVDDDIAELAAEEVSGLLAGTRLAGATVVPVSATTGQGLDRLRDALAEIAAATAPRTPRTGPARLAIDRSFEMRGFGPVVTGTLVGAELAVGDAIELLPAGLRGRVRGVQRHGEKVDRAEPGARCALNLQGIELPDLTRGGVVAQVGRVPTTQVFDARVRWLAEAPPAQGPTAVALLVGTAERRARLAPIGDDSLAPGQAGFARIHVDGEPVAVLPGDRFVLRGFARTEIGATLGGGLVLDVAPPHRRRSDPTLLSDLERLEQRDPASDLLVRVVRSGLAGCARDALALETGMQTASFEAALHALVAEDAVHLARDQRVIGADALAELQTRLRDALDAFHTAEPLRPGMPVAALRGALPSNVTSACAELALEKAAATGDLVIQGDVVRRVDHRAELSGPDAAIAERVCDVLSTAALEPPGLRDLAAAVDAKPDALGDLLGHLEREGRIVRAPGDLWFDARAVDELRDRVRAHLASEGSLDTQSYKSMIGTTRRTAVPLMELFDAEHVTARRGAVRVRGRRAGG